MKHKTNSFMGLMLALVLVSACGSTGSDLGSIFGGNNDQAQSGTLSGTVDSVDGNSIYLTNVSGLGSMLSNSGNSGRSVRVYFDTRTTVEYQGQGYNPQDLERGDEVSVQVSESGNQLVADRVTVTRDVTIGGSNDNGGYDNSTMSTIRGTVRSIDTSRRTIELERTSWMSGFNPGAGNTATRITVQYGTNTDVLFSGNSYPVTSLERGDVIDVRVGRSGSAYIADRISVVRDVNSQ